MKGTGKEIERGAQVEKEVERGGAKKTEAG